MISSFQKWIKSTVVNKVVIARINEIDENDDMKDAGKDIVLKCVEMAEKKSLSNIDQKSTNNLIGEILDILIDFADGVKETALNLRSSKYKHRK